MDKLSNFLDTPNSQIRESHLDDFLRSDFMSVTNESMTIEKSDMTFDEV